MSKFPHKLPAQTKGNHKAKMSFKKARNASWSENLNSPSRVRQALGHYFLARINQWRRHP